MNEITIFENPEFGQIRTLSIENEPWFVGKDVAKRLGYSNPKKAVWDHVDEEDKRGFQIGTPGGNQEMTIINESGLYSLIFASKLDSAKRFKRWVTSEVLPAIRKTGAYDSKLEIAKVIASCKSATAVKGILSLYGISSSNLAKTHADSVSAYLESVDEWEITSPSTKEVYEDYCAFCEETNTHPLSLCGFSKAVHNWAGLEVKRRRVNGILTGFYT